MPLTVPEQAATERFAALLADRLAALDDLRTRHADAAGAVKQRLTLQMRLVQAGVDRLTRLAGR